MTVLNGSEVQWLSGSVVRWFSIGSGWWIIILYTTLAVAPPL